MSTTGNINAGGAVVTITARENVQKTLNQVEKRFGTFAGKLDDVRKATEALKLYAVGRGFAEVGRAIEQATVKLATGEGNLRDIAAETIRGTILIGDFVKGWDGLIGAISGSTAEQARLNAEMTRTNSLFDAQERAMRETEKRVDSLTQATAKFLTQQALAAETDPERRRELEIQLSGRENVAGITRDAARDAAEVLGPLQAEIKKQEAAVQAAERRLAEMRDKFRFEQDPQNLALMSGPGAAFVPTVTAADLSAAEAQLRIEQGRLNQALNTYETAGFDMLSAADAARGAAQLLEGTLLDQAYDASRVADAEKLAADEAERRADQYDRIANVIQTIGSKIGQQAADQARAADAAMREAEAHNQRRQAIIDSVARLASPTGQFGGDRLNQLVAATMPRFVGDPADVQEQKRTNELLKVLNATEKQVLSEIVNGAFRLSFN